MSLDYSKFEKFKKYDDYHLDLKRNSNNLISNNLVEPSKKSRKESFGQRQYNPQTKLEAIYDNTKGQLKVSNFNNESTVGDNFNNPWNFYDENGLKVIDINDYWPLKPSVLSKIFLDSEITSGLVQVSDSTPLEKDEGGNKHIGPPPNAIKRKGEIYCICEVVPDTKTETERKALTITDVWSGLPFSVDGPFDPKPPNPLILNTGKPKTGKYGGQYDPIVIAYFGGFPSTIDITKNIGDTVGGNVLKSFSNVDTDPDVANALKDLVFLVNSVYIRIGPALYDYNGESDKLSGNDILKLYINSYSGGKYTDAMIKRANQVLQKISTSIPNSLKIRARPLTSTPNNLVPVLDHCAAGAALSKTDASDMLITQTDPYHCVNLVSQAQPTIFVQSGIRLNLFSDIMIYEQNDTLNLWNSGSDCNGGGGGWNSAKKRRIWNYDNNFGGMTPDTSPKSDRLRYGSTFSSIKFGYYYKTQELTGFTFKNWNPSVTKTPTSLGRTDLWHNIVKARSSTIIGVGASSDIKGCALNLIFKDTLKSVNTLSNPGNLNSSTSSKQKKIPEFSTIPNSYLRMPVNSIIDPAIPLTPFSDRPMCTSVLKTKATRVDCGYIGINKQACESRGCCWDEITEGERAGAGLEADIPFCYKPGLQDSISGIKDPKAYLLEIGPIIQPGLSASSLAKSLLSAEQLTSLSSLTPAPTDTAESFSSTKTTLKNSLFGRYSPQFIDFISGQPNDAEMVRLYGEGINSAKALDFYGKIRKEKFQSTAQPEIIPALKAGVVKFIEFGANSDPPTPEGIEAFKIESLRNSGLKTHYKGCTDIDINIPRFKASDRNLAKCNDPTLSSEAKYKPKPRYLFLLPYGTPGSQKNVVNAKLYSVGTRNSQNLVEETTEKGGKTTGNTLGGINDGSEQTIGSGTIEDNKSGRPGRETGGYDSNIENMDIGNAEDKSSEGVLAAVQACRDQMKNAAEEKKNDPNSNPECVEGQITVDTNEIPITTDTDGNVLEPDDVSIYRVDGTDKILSKYFYKASGNGTWYGKCEPLPKKQTDTILKNFIGNTGCGPSNDITKIINKIGINWAQLSEDELSGRTELTTEQALTNLIQNKVNSAKNVVPRLTSKELSDIGINSNNLKTSQYIKIVVDGRNRYYRPLGPSSNVASGDTKTDPRDLFPFVPTEKDKSDTIMLNYVCSNDTTQKCSDIPNGVCKVVAEGPVDAKNIFTGTGASAKTKTGILQSDYNIAPGVKYNPESSTYPCIWVLTEAGKSTIGADAASQGVKKINKDSSTRNIGLKIMKTQKKFVWNLPENVDWTRQSSEPTKEELHDSLGTPNEEILYAKRGNTLSAPSAEQIANLYVNKVKSQGGFFTVEDVGAFYQSCDPFSSSTGATDFPSPNGNCTKGVPDDALLGGTPSLTTSNNKWVVEIPACAGVPTIVNPQCALNSGSQNVPTADQLRRGNCAPAPTTGSPASSLDAYKYPIYLQVGQPDTCLESIINSEAEADSDVERSQRTNAVGIGGSPGIEQIQTVNVKLGGGFACKSISNKVDRLNCYNQNSCFSRESGANGAITADKFGGKVPPNYTRTTGNLSGPGQCLYFPPTNNVSPTEKKAETENKLEGGYYDTKEDAGGGVQKNTLNVGKATQMNPNAPVQTVGPGWPELTSDEWTRDRQFRCSDHNTKNPLCGNSQPSNLFTSGVGTIQNLTTWDNEARYNNPTRVGLLKYANSCKDACENFANNTVHRDKYLKGVELQNAIANVYTPEEFILSDSPEDLQTYGEKFLENARNNYVCKCPIKKFKPSSTCACDMSTDILTKEMQDNLTKNGLEIKQNVADNLNIDSLTNAATSQTKVDDLIYRPTKFNGRTCMSVNGPNQDQINSLQFPVNGDGQLQDQGTKLISGLTPGVGQQLPATGDSINFLARLPKCGACQMSNSQKQTERIIITDNNATLDLNQKGGTNINKEVKILKGICQKTPLSGNESIAENATPGPTSTPSAIGPNSKPVSHIPKFLGIDGKCYIPHTVKRVNGNNVPVTLEIQKGKFATFSTDSAVETQVNTTLKYQNNTELEAIFMIENRCRLKTASSENSENINKDKTKTTTGKKESDCPTGYENFYGKAGLPPMGPGVNDADKLRLIPCCTEEGPKLPCKPKSFNIINPRISNVQICSQAMAEGNNGEPSGLAKLMTALGADSNCVQAAQASGSAMSASAYAKASGRVDAWGASAQASAAAGAGFATQNSQMSELTSGCKTVMANILKSSSVINNLACSINSTKINSTLQFTAEKSATIKTLPVSAEILQRVDNMIANNKAVLKSAIIQVGQIVTQGGAEAKEFQIQCVGPILDIKGNVIYDDPRRGMVPDPCGSYAILNFARDQTTETNKTIEKILDRSITITNSKFDFSTKVTLNNAVQSQTQNSIDMLADSITQQGSSNDFASSLTAGAGAGTDPAASVSSLNSQEISKKITQSAFSLNEQIINVNTRSKADGKLYLESPGPININGATFDFSSVSNITNEITSKAANDSAQTAKTKNNQEAFNATKQQKNKRGVDDIARELGIANANALRAVGESVGLESLPEPVQGAQTLRTLIIAIAVVGSLIAVGGIVGGVVYFRGRGRKKPAARAD